MCYGLFLPEDKKHPREFRENETSGVMVSEAWNEYYLNGYHGELKSYKYSDKGSLGEDGNGKFDYATAIKYTDNAAKHIFGLPVDVTVTGGDASQR